MLKASKTRPEPEDLLLDYAERLTHHRAGRRALTVALSGLAPPIRPDDHWRVVENLIQPLILRHGGEIFRLKNGDVAVVFTSLDQAMADRLTHKLRYLFRDDPLIRAEERASAPAAFARCYDIHREYDAFLAFARLAKDTSATALPATADDLAALTPDDLKDELPHGGGVDKDPRNAPIMQWLKAPARGAPALHALAHKVPAVRLRPNERASVALEYFTPRLDAVMALGMPAADLERNEELAHQLTGLTARRLMVELPAAFKSEQPLAISLSLDDLLSPELLNFHRAWAVGRWVPVTFCIPLPEESSEDFERLRYVRTMLRGLGHRLALGPLPLDIYQRRGMTSPDKLNANLVFFAWDPRYAQAEASAEVKALRAWLSEAPAQDVMLIGVDARDALNFGQSLGLTLFAGRQAAALVGR